MTKKTKNKYNH